MTASHRISSILTVAGLGLVLALAACSSTQSPGDQVDDAWITSKITAKFTADPEVNNFNIDVDIQQGVVTLSGTVRTDFARQHAAELAAGVKGAASVDNRIKVEQ